MKNLDLLATAVVKQAVADWRKLIKMGVKNHIVTEINISFIEIERFLKSEFCDSLLDIDPLIILEQLKKERG